MENYTYDVHAMRANQKSVQQGLNKMGGLGWRAIAFIHSPGSKRITVIFEKADL